MHRHAHILLLAVSLAGCVSFHQGPLPDEPTDASFAEVADTRVRYVDTGGDGPPVVLIHGFAASLDTWAAVMPALAANHRVIALDLKGFGWSGRPEGGADDYSPQAQARLVFDLLSDLGIDSAAVVAHSWGSSVALQMALAQPRRVERIALYDAWVYEEQLPVAFRWARAPVVGELIFGLFYRERQDDKMELAFHDKSYVTYELVEDTRQAMARPGTTAAALAAVRGQRYAEVQTRYSTIHQPVLLLWGEDDVVTTQEMGNRLHQQLPNSTLISFGDCGHFPMIEAYHPSTDALVEFLAPVVSRRDAPIGTPVPVESSNPPSQPTEAR
jgi:pimeloyl-ACP methyl ester carboxylesterase